LGFLIDLSILSLGRLGETAGPELQVRGRRIDVVRGTLGVVVVVIWFLIVSLVDVGWVVFTVRLNRMRGSSLSTLHTGASFKKSSLADSSIFSVDFDLVTLSSYNANSHIKTGLTGGIS